ncbi:MAG: cytochrome c [Nitrospirales bacterium]
MGPSLFTIGFLVWTGLVFASDVVKEASQPDVKKGESIYQAHCVECHGPSGRGDGPRAALLAPRPGNLISAATSTKTDQELLAIIEHGVPRTAMHGWETTLSESDRKDVLAFIRSLVHFQEPALTPPPP